MGAARVRENWFFALIHPGDMISEGQADVNRQVLSVFAGV
jgi:hypothetical protein